MGIARRDGNRRYYDLIERLVPPELLHARETEDDALRHRLLSRYRAVGLLAGQAPADVIYSTGSVADRTRWVSELVEAGTLLPAAVEGVKQLRYLMADELPVLEATASRSRRAPAVTFLAPLDPLVWDRRLLRELFGFDYTWEVYVPAAKRSTATTSCRCCSATGSWAVSSRGWTGGRATWQSPASGSSRPSSRWRNRTSSTRCPRRCSLSRVRRRRIDVVAAHPLGSRAGGRAPAQRGSGMTVWLWLLLAGRPLLPDADRQHAPDRPAWREGRLSSGGAALAVAALRGLTVTALVAAITLVAGLPSIPGLLSAVARRRHLLRCHAPLHQADVRRRRIGHPG